METKLLALENLSIAVGGGKNPPLAVRGISLEAGGGELVGLAGESGCGKSLTALSIPGLLPEGVRIAGGSIMFGGTDLAAESERGLRALRGSDITMVFQEPMSSLNPLMKVGSQIAEPLRLHGAGSRAEIRARVLEMIEKVELPEPERIYKAYPHQLSGGQRQRVMLAIALVCRPRLLIADEPTTALDAAVQSQILELLKRLNASLGTTVLFISHDLNVIRSLCSRVYVMYAGRICESGTAAEIFGSPAHEYTKGLIASVPRREMRGMPLLGIPGRVPPVEKYGDGCPFAPRCARRTGECGKRFPEVSRLSDTHFASCYRVASRGGEERDDE
ncbi:MAG: ABC transporter ATP-binding protein [Oscillospiraceae bacterium]|nr:ABC transporter ATP-binding protein [Oscillospiraceae bacterium]